MNKKFEFYHGVVWSKLIHFRLSGISIKPFPTASNASYIIDERIGLYVKHSTKRLSPWIFSFQKIHQIEIEGMRNALSEVYVILICGEDGIVTLSYDELKVVLDTNHKQTEWISASRSRNTEYTIKGSDGILKSKVGKNDFPSKIFNTKMDFSITSLLQ